NAVWSIRETIAADTIRAEGTNETVIGQVKDTVNIDAVAIPVRGNAVPGSFDGSAGIIGDGGHNACENAINVDAGTIHARDDAAVIVRHRYRKSVERRISTGNPGASLDGAAVGDLNAGILLRVNAVATARAAAGLNGSGFDHAGVADRTVEPGTDGIASGGT